MCDAKLFRGRALPGENSLARPNATPKAPGVRQVAGKGHVGKTEF